MKKVLILFLLLTLLLTACFNKKEEEKESVIFAIENSVGMVFSSDSVVQENEIRTKNENLSLVKRKGKGSIIAITGNIKEGDKILTYNTKYKLELIDIIKEEDLSILSKKEIGEEKLLGDFNEDNVVDISDFSLFAQNYGNDTEIKYDIFPSSLGTGDWNGIYAYLTGDNKVNIYDFIIFGKNFGKEKPYETSKLELIEIKGNKTKFNVGESGLFTVETVYSDGTIKYDDKDLKWSSNNENIVKIEKGLLTALNEGKTKIKVEKENKIHEIEVSVEKKVIGIYVDETYGNQLHTWGGEETFLEEFPGKTLTEKYKEFVYYIFRDSEEINFVISKEGKKVSDDLLINKTIWIDKNGNKSDYYPYAPQAPSIFISKLNETVKGNSIIEIIIKGGKIVGKSASFNGREIVLTGEKTSLIASDYIENEETALIEVIVKNEVGTTIETGTFKRNDSKRLENLNQLGAIYSFESTSFKYWSPNSSNVVLNFDGNDYQCTKLADENGYTNVYGLRIEGDCKGKKYSFKVDGKTQRDPYGKMVEGETLNFIVMDTASIEPNGAWVLGPEFIEREDAIIYELHVRDITIDSTSGVSEGKKGKFLGLVEEGTNYLGTATGIDYLKELGVTHVQILPMADYPDNWGTYNWGYGSLNYNIPEDRYSTLERNDYEGRIKEWQTMVNEFHKNGIMVIMDVVYNHTPTEFVMPEHYYHEGLDLSACGNSVDVGNPMISRWVQDSLEYLVQTYNIDGFRFDLMGVHEYEEVAKWSKNLNKKFPNKKLLFYGEPWNGGANDPKESQKTRLDKLKYIEDAHIGAFNDQFRNAIKGEGDHEGMGYMFNFREPAIYGKNIHDIAMGVKGSIEQFASDPEQTINYVTAHDNFALWDKIKYSAGYDQFNVQFAYAKRISMFGQGIVLTSQGIPFIHGGEEILRTKSPDGDMSWENKIPESVFEVIKNTNDDDKGGDDTNKFRWNWKIDNSDVFDYNKGLIKIRKEHPAFRMNSKEEIEANVRAEVKSDSVLLTYINGDGNADTWKNIILVYNSGDNYELNLDGEWKLAVSGTNANVGGELVSGSYTCEGTAVTILYQE